ncbi:DUF413 domain-containing protein [Pseudoalteromonas sp. C2R02]|uniref:DUF413 domain-containing protein n=1 Tax=Pseudoalteromonas sp. C2R02 TaxID=2841565 RepID=UPI001C087E08|nr:DUF413 domain-containing protein [Pseudoalteromonas sp. C2R02]MBU2970002.1 DUF413 domain-containing protein [Pseudoalteromonas sp. C2R02]
MTLIHGFISVEQFYDDAYFSRNFKKRGDFSIAKAGLLSNIGKRIFMLEQKLSISENQVEEQFVQMCQSQLEGQTKIELLWRKQKINEAQTIP